MKKEIINIDIVKEPPYELTKGGLNLWDKLWQSKPKEIEFLSIDLFMVAAYCEEMALYYRCRRFVKKNGLFYYPNKETKGGESKQQYKVVHPEVAIGNNAFKNAQSLSSKLGLSPLDRKKLGGVVTSKNKNVYDPFAEAN
jgi:P27 family predicted phage terminase small subunit